MTTIPTGRFVWFEYLTPDPAKAQGFFGEVLGWNKQVMPIPGGGEYTMIAAGTNTIGGYPPLPAGAPQRSHWISHLQVADAHATAAKVEKLGGKVLSKPVDMGMGTHAIVTDPLGGAFSLWQPAKAEGTGDYKGTAGAFCWNELYTDDPDRSVEFYQAIGGFDVERKDMGPMGVYSILTSDGKHRAGVMKKPMPEIPQSWLPYVQVASCDATVDKAKKLGATIIVPTNEVPEVGRFSLFLDPLGATLGVLQPPPR